MTGMPNGLGGSDTPKPTPDRLVEGTLPQHRVTKLSPRPATADDLKGIFRNALRYW